MFSPQAQVPIQDHTLRLVEMCPQSASIKPISQYFLTFITLTHWKIAGIFDRNIVEAAISVFYTAQ